MSAATSSGTVAAEMPAPARSGRKKVLLLAGIPVLALLVVAGLWFSGVLRGLTREAPKVEAQDQHRPREDAQPAPIFVEMPEIITNLNGNPRRPSYIKVKTRLEVASQDDVTRVQAAMPRLLDMVQTFLREMRPEELRGSAGIYRVREELIARANIAATPAHVVDVLFVEMLIQ
jgi:flagellar FliL protein